MRHSGPLKSGDPVWVCAKYSVSLDRPRIMAIINLTTDSFSGDGLATRIEDAVRAAERALENGAAILDVGGESSRPGADPVSVQEEIDRVAPAIEQISRLGVPVSIDTVKPEVMCAAIKAGACIVNDINALQAPGATDVIRNSSVGVCLMHMQGNPLTMQVAPRYVDPVGEVFAFLASRAREIELMGVAPNRIVLDPGFGFGKTLSHNLQLLRSLKRMLALGYPILAGVSRKSMLGLITGRPVESRIAASVAAALLAVEDGAHIVRVHDVAETRDALLVWEAMRCVQEDE